MTEEQLKKFINDTRGLIRGASAEKKIKLLKLIKEAKRKCEETKLDEMQLDAAKVDETLSSKFAPAALAGALRAGGANTVTQRIHPNLDKKADYLEEK